LLPSIETLTYQSDVTLATLLVSSIDASSIAQLNDSETGLWEAYMQVLKIYLHPSSEPGPRDVLIQLLETELLSKLVYRRQITICEVIIGTVSRDTDAVRRFSHCSILGNSCLVQRKYGKKLLTSTIKNVPLIVELLNVYSPTPQGASPRAAKRAKIITEYEH